MTRTWVITVLFPLDFRPLYKGCVRIVSDGKITTWDSSGTEGKGNYVSFSGRLSESVNYVIIQRENIANSTLCVCACAHVCEF